VKCGNPFVKDGKAYGCGQCLPCRINRRRVWTHRIMLEAALHADNAFITLTYSDEHLPIDGNVHVGEMQRWLKRLRKELAPAKIRYFLVGEYGEISQRPHYHAMVFGYPGCLNGVTSKKEKCCTSCDLIRRTWPFGHVYLGTVTRESAQYISGYTAKGWTNPNNPALQNRSPEFARMSLRPGIGADITWEIASAILPHLDETQDVPSILRHGKSILPLGRYLTKLLRARCGRDTSTPKVKLDEMEAKLLPLRQYAFTNSKSFKTTILEENEGQRINVEAREKRKRKKGYQ